MNFVGIYKNVANYRPESNFIKHPNNYNKKLKPDESNVAKKFNISSLIYVLHISYSRCLFVCYSYCNIITLILSSMKKLLYN